MFLTDAYTQPHALVQEFTFNDDPIERKNNNLSSGSVQNIKAKTTMQKYEDRIKLVEVCLWVHDRTTHLAFLQKWIWEVHI